ncbi:flagellar basal-body MS-ring/collar protein FliF [Sphingoaurantiacus capsulatus]|uniref:Flagellar M-ring protein n=1 Tax=Sphingoaurantiacus capsulatus TaxID=1771310 RepID=A0ABV7XGS2_9SPHN
MSELTATATTVPGATASSAKSPLEFLGTVKGLAAQPAVVKAMPMLMLMAVVGLGALIWAAISAPPQREMFAGLADNEKAAVVEALSASGIEYEISSGGGITVSEDNYHQARMLLASQGLPKSSPGGDDVVSSLPLGASRAVEGEKLRTAKELDLARSIEAIDSVQSARVHLALDTPSVFLRDRSRRAASVMIRLAPGRALGDNQVQAIVHLVASSVPGLAPDSVSVVDQAGRLLSSGSGQSASSASDRQVAIQQAVETRYVQSLTTLLTPIVGHGNFTAEVHADIDFSEVQATREDFPQAATALAREERTWNGAEGGQQEAGGIPGAMSNQPPTAASIAAAPGGKVDTKAAGTEELSGAGLAGSGNYKRNYALGREVSVTKKPTGDIQRLTVAVAIRNPEGGDPLSKKDLQSIEALVKGAVGYKADRGDVVALNALSFAPIEESALEQWYEATWISPAIRTVGGVIVAALAVFGIGLPLLRRKGMMPGMPSMPSIKGAARNDSEAAKIAASMEKELAAALAQRPRPDPADVTLSMIEAAPSYEARAVLIRNFVRENPARAALVVRDLLKAGKSEGVSKVG